MAMNIHRVRRIPPALALIAALGGCRGAMPGGGARGADADSTAQPAPATAPIAPASGMRVSDSTAVPRRIYYELTDFDWYQKGEPLMVEGAPYDVAGPPLRRGSAGLEAAGSYEGVDYYRARDGGDTVFVPVYPLYWQPFARRGAGTGTTE